MTEHILTDDEKAMYLMLMDWHSGIADSRPYDIDYTKHYVAGQRYWNHPDRHGWHLTLDKAFEFVMNGNK